jgi:hypothetical protein
MSNEHPLRSEPTLILTLADEFSKVDRLLDDTDRLCHSLGISPTEGGIREKEMSSATTETTFVAATR